MRCRRPNLRVLNGFPGDIMWVCLDVSHRTIALSNDVNQFKPILLELSSLFDGAREVDHRLPNFYLDRRIPIPWIEKVLTPKQGVQRILPLVQH